MIIVANRFSITINVILLFCYGIDGKPNGHVNIQLQQRDGSNICTTPGCARANEELLKFVDESVDPCENFYEFACGSFLKANDNKRYTEVSPRGTAKNDMENKFHELIAKPLEPNAPKHAVLVGQLYDSCTKGEISHFGKSDLITIIKALGGWPVVQGSNWNPDNFDLVTFHRNARQIGFRADFLNQVSVYPHPDHSSMNVILMSYSPRIFKHFSNAVKTQNSFNEMVDAAVRYGAKKEYATKDLAKSFEFEKKLYEFTEQTNLSVKSITVKEIQELSPNIRWVDYLNSIIAMPGQEIDSSEVVLFRKSSYLGLLKFLGSVPKRTLANYMVWKVMLELLEHVKAYKEPISCALKVIESLPVASSALYIRNYFDAETKNSATDLVGGIKAQFRSTLETREWMNENIRKKALEKIDAMQYYVAYPDELLDDSKLEEYYSDLKLYSIYYLIDILKANKFMIDNEFRQLRYPVDKTFWTEHSKLLELNAFYIPQNNLFDLPAGYLQGNYFNKNNPNYMNYGSMGFIIGHEITHGFDVNGANFDKDGNRVYEWGNDTEYEFNKRSECFVNQYNGYRVPEVEKNIDGRMTLGENTADNGGARSAYWAYNRWATTHQPEGSLPSFAKYTQNQMFWISMTNPWCAVVDNTGLNRQLTDVHAPNRYRILGTLVNNKDFARDFSCPSGSKMNPKEKCRVW